MGEVVLVYFKDQPAFYARVEEIMPDNAKRDWYHITLLILSFPSRNVIWTLREEYIDGETFNMKDIPLRIETVEAVLVEEVVEEPVKKNFGKKGNVIPFRKPSKKQRRKNEKII